MRRVLSRMVDAADFTHCHCTNIQRAEVLAAIADGCRTVDQLRAVIGVCTGCGTCRPELDAVLTACAPQRDGGKKQ